MSGESCLDSHRTWSLSPRRLVLTNRCSREELPAKQSPLVGVETSMLAAAALLAPLLLDIEAASAAGNPLLTGKTISLLHPAVMFSLLGSTIYTGILGWNWRRTRLIPVRSSGRARARNLLFPLSLCQLVIFSWGITPLGLGTSVPTSAGA